MPTHGPVTSTLEADAPGLRRPSLKCAQEHTTRRPARTDYFLSSRVIIRDDARISAIIRGRLEELPTWAASRPSHTLAVRRSGPVSGTELEDRHQRPLGLPFEKEALRLIASGSRPLAEKIDPHGSLWAARR